MLNMTKYFTKRLFNEFYSLNIKLLLVIAVFSFYSTYNLSILSNSVFSVFEYALLCVNDHYYIVFFFLVMYFVIITRSLKDSTALIMIRNGRYFLYYISKLTAIAIFTLSIVLLHVMIIIIIGSFKLSWDNSFSSTLSSSGHFSELSILYTSCFHSPLAALISVCLYWSLGLCVCSGTLMLLSHHFSEKAVILTKACAYLLIIVTLHRNVDRTAPYLFINNYLFLHRAIGYGIPIVLTVISVMLLVVMMIIANRQRKQVLKCIINPISLMRTFGEVLSSKSSIALLIASLVLSVLNVLKFKADANSGLEHTIVIFWGYGLGYFKIIDLLQLIILNGIPLYILSAYFGDNASMRGIEMIRYRHRRKWFANVQLSMLTLILVQLTLMCLFTFSIGSVFISFGISGNNEGSLLSDITYPICVIIIGLILRIFEIMFLQMVFLVAFSLVKSITISFLATLFLYLSIVLFNAKFIPFGLSSLCRVFELSNNGLLINSIVPATIFAGCYVVMYMYLVKYGVIRILNCERNYT